MSPFARSAPAAAFAIVATWASLVDVAARAQSPDSPAAIVDAHLASGEFAAARALIDQLDAGQQDDARGRLAIAVAQSGNRDAAVDEVARIEQPDQLRRVIPRLTQPQSLGGSAAITDEPALAGAGNERASGAGGGTIADFTALMDLIQTTIAPDTWEALGGPSTMAEYRSGIHVDPSGLVKDISVDRSDRLLELKNRVLNRDAAGAGRSNVDWTAPSDLRVVSLAALRRSLLRRRIEAQPPTLAMQNFAGLSSVRYIILSDEDVFLAGPVGGIDPAAVPWPRDQHTGRTPLGLDLLVSAASAVRKQASFGCSIDPTEQGLAAAALVADRIDAGQQPIATAADAISAALGRQKISLFDVPGDQPLAWLLVDADRHMKQLALGVHPMPEGLPNYFDVIDRSVRQNPSAGIPGGQLLRLWFAPQAKRVRGSADRRTFEMEGLPLRLMSAREFATAAGDRHQAGPDPLGAEFARRFTEAFESIATTYPVYDRLRGAFELTAAMQLIHGQVGAVRYARLLGDLTLPDLHGSGSLSVPRQCESIAVRHTIRTANHRHEVLVASGGIQIDPAISLVSSVEPYPPLDQMPDSIGDPPHENNRWWWDQSDVRISNISDAAAITRDEAWNARW